jgi:hypothetical protein
MPSSEMLRRVTLVRTNVLEERIASIIMATRIGDPRTLAVTKNIRMDLRDIGKGCVDRIGPVRGRDKWRFLMIAGINLRVLQNAEKLSSGCTTDCLPSSVQLHRIS